MNNKLMRKIAFIFCCFWISMSPLLAQDMSKEQQQIDSLTKVLERLKMIDALKKQIDSLQKSTEKKPFEPPVTPELTSKPLEDTAVVAPPPPPVPDTSEIKSDLEISPELMKKLEARAVEMITELTEQINIIGYKPNTEKKKNDAITSAMNLFSGEDNTVEVRSVKNPKNPVTMKKIRLYLNNLKMLAYTDIKFTAYEVRMTNNLTKMEGKDGYYYGTASFCQKFEYDMPSSSIEIKNYTRKVDITCKNVQIIVRQEKVYGENVWRVFLGDISVDDYKK